LTVNRVPITVRSRRSHRADGGFVDQSRNDRLETRSHT